MLRWLFQLWTLQSLFIRAPATEALEFGDCCALKIKRPRFDSAGSFTLRQIAPGPKILARYELVGLQVSVAVEGSSVSLHCTASSLPASTRLLWIDWEGREAVSGQEGGNRTLTLEVPTDVQRGEWTCALLEGGFPKAVYPYQLHTSTVTELLDGCFTDSVLFCVLVGYLTVKTAACVALWFCFKKRLDIEVEKEMRPNRLSAATARGREAGKCRPMPGDETGKLKGNLHSAGPGGMSQGSWRVEKEESGRAARINRLPVTRTGSNRQRLSLPVFNVENKLLNPNARQADRLTG
ncbi:hypothetical protein EOD39_13910 [Acipenser ruthenus]|uniref:Ig-like domain-containing protein n=1 Tax=Acipenser ruthenus TaxID=7906 RepID=A0A662YP68_ACIRT|nr:hypothetical protein EOD39_13910 [Acipenser ruthenus]